MLDQARLRSIAQAAEQDDWGAAGDEYLELRLGAQEVRDRFAVESLAPALRLRDSKQLAGIVEQILGEPRS